MSVLRLTLFWARIREFNSIVLLCEVVISSLIMMKSIWLGPKAPFPLKETL